MNNLKPNKQRAKNVITLIWIVFVLEIISFISGYLQYNLLQTVATGGEISPEAANANDIREQIISIIFMIVYIISGITFIQWFRRAYYNLHLKVNHLTYKDSWAAIGWFIPIMYLYRPYQIMKELYQETKELLIKKDLVNSVSLKTSFLGWWWTLWIISNLLGQFVFRYYMKAETVNEIMISTQINMLTNILGIPLALITIKVIKDYAYVEPLLTMIQDENIL